MQNNYTLPTTQTNTCTWEYHVVSDRRIHPDTGVYRSYGIHAFEINGMHIRPAAYVHDITSIQTKAEHLAELLNRYQLSPVHLHDVIEDYLADAPIFYR